MMLKQFLAILCANMANRPGAFDAASKSAAESCGIDLAVATVAHPAAPAAPAPAPATPAPTAPAQAKPAPVKPATAPVKPATAPAKPATAPAKPAAAPAKPAVIDPLAQLGQLLGIKDPAKLTAVGNAVVALVKSKA